MRLYRPIGAVAFLLAVITCLSSTVGYSLPLTTKSPGTIIGRVLDFNTARVANAAITIDNQEVKRRMKSDEEGEFEVSLPAGVYRITVEANGFRRSVCSSVKIRPTATRRINIYLDVAEPPGLVPASGSAK